ncbi:DUF4362 domain-containing protein [Clostridium beijerinckii]|uniref:Cell wall-binding protein n=1 Tax=Clostridium beijerinckii TaxID=1520 RepID=A0AAX0BD31_CLOBE|nr:DUF4362 domain-containing protein [Clostridium beijerinckii]MBA8937801.1 hypothetical protein [Clostridium beijerinckii]MBA8937811.1 hypothetical protein [Clostridium beijerinckii]MBA8937824.1 hypothetical protein [Clostridium beijerinckii]NRT92394.1 hypothetical protein [Clostridium beijerinckii]NRU41676.1 hypothetical protein [Clostridium beijerinckii]
MKKLNLFQIVASLLTLVSALTLNSIGASAQWKQDSKGWWNTEGSSWSIGWRYIDGEWYYFDNNGYMKTGWILDGGKWYHLNDSGEMSKNTTIDGYLVDSNGVWIQPKQNSYKELDKLPYEYNTDIAQKNGDVVKIHNQGINVDFNIEKLDEFIESYKNKKAYLGDMVRITCYGDEGGAIIRDLVIDSEGIKLMEDITRDEYSPQKNRVIKTYRIVDIYKTNATGCILYYAKTDQGNEKFLYSSEIH